MCYKGQGAVKGADTRYWAFWGPMSGCFRGEDVDNLAGVRKSSSEPEIYAVRVSIFPQ